MRTWCNWIIFFRTCLIIKLFANYSLDHAVDYGYKRYHKMWMRLWMRFNVMISFTSLLEYIDSTKKKKEIESAHLCPIILGDFVRVHSTVSYICLWSRWAHLVPVWKWWICHRYYMEGCVTDQCLCLCVCYTLCGHVIQHWVRDWPFHLGHLKLNFSSIFSIHFFPKRNSRRYFLDLSLDTMYRVKFITLINELWFPFSNLIHLRTILEKKDCFI